MMKNGIHDDVAPPDDDRGEQQRAAAASNAMNVPCGVMQWWDDTHVAHSPRSTNHLKNERIRLTRRETPPPRRWIDGSVENSSIILSEEKKNNNGDDGDFSSSVIALTSDVVRTGKVPSVLLIAHHALKECQPLEGMEAKKVLAIAALPGVLEEHSAAAALSSETGEDPTDPTHLPGNILLALAGEELVSRCVRSYPKKTPQELCEYIAAVLRYRARVGADTLLRHVPSADPTDASYHILPRALAPDFQPSVELPSLAQAWRLFHVGWPSVVLKATDRWGHPILVDRISQMQSEPLQVLPVDLLELFHVQVMEALSVEKRTVISPAHGQRIYKHIYVMDVGGLSLTMAMSSRILSTASRLAKLDKQIYTDTLHKLYITNTPTAFWALWSVASTWLHSDTLKKVVILRGDGVKELVEDDGVDAESLPEFLGGTCRGGVVSAESLVRSHQTPAAK